MHRVHLRLAAMNSPTRLLLDVGGSFLPSNIQLRSRWELCSSRVNVTRIQGRGVNKKMNVKKYRI